MPSGSQVKLNKEDEISKFFFEDTAEEYFDRFASNGINFIAPDRDYIQDKNGTGVSYLWFSSPVDDSDLAGNLRCLDDDGGVSG